MSDELRKPKWLRVRVGQGADFKRMEDIIKRYHLHTVCEEALCPNLGECWCHGHATVMILGGKCTRGCKFCNVAPESGTGQVDEDEPERVADAIGEAGLKEVVITSVTRDDLADGGAGIWARTIKAVRGAAPEAIIEVLLPDFAGDWASCSTAFSALPDVMGHNLETVPGLYPAVRPEADYQRSLEMLRHSAAAGLITKTSIMLGLGEKQEDVISLMTDAYSAGCSIFFIGHYLRPSRAHYPVVRYVEPSEFEELKRIGLEIGFDVVVSSPLVRSSYHSDEQSKYVRNVLSRSG